jgi:hypothetical protein
MSLDEAFTKLKSVSKALGRSSGQRLELMKAMGYAGNSGPSGRAVASLGYFGFIEKVSGSEYKVSDLGMRSIYTEPSNKAALREAALEPSLYAQLYERYKASTLPELAQLKNTLVLSYKINDTSAETAAKDFMATMRFAGLLGDNGKLGDIEAEADEAGTPDGDIPADTPASNASAGTPPAAPPSHPEAVPRRLPSGIIIYFPEDLDTAVTFGLFGTELLSLETKANDLRKQSSPAQDTAEESAGQPSQTQLA